MACLAAACGGPAIDASTDSTMQASIEHIRSRLDAAEQQQFDAALNDLNDMLFNRADSVSQATVSQYRPDALVRKILHRKTAREVIRMVERHRRQTS